MYPQRTTTYMNALCTSTSIGVGVGIYSPIQERTSVRIVLHTDAILRSWPCKIMCKLKDGCFTTKPGFFRCRNSAIILQFTIPSSLKLMVQQKRIFWYYSKDLNLKQLREFVSHALHLQITVLTKQNILQWCATAGTVMFGRKQLQTCVVEYSPMSARMVAWEIH